MAKHLAPKGISLAVLLSIISLVFLVACTGPQGDRGSSGATGQSGLQGEQGPSGSSGAPGLSGSQGSSGPAGREGPQGPTGSRGSAGAQGIAGPQGPEGSLGAAGRRGPQGAAGPPGPPGPPGGNAVSPWADVIVAAVETGGTTSVWGSGFGAFERISLVAGATSGGNDVILGSSVANQSGAFSAEVGVDLGPGIYSLWAIGDDGSQATAPLLILAEK